ncbi:MAG: hypothetical protein QQN62_04160 [Nitrosopumilus sp.]|nr:hypothetical protein [Nitrososphaerota archaeon]
MIEREKINELGYLDVQRNRGKFLTNKFNKSKSTSTVDFAISPEHQELTIEQHIEFHKDYDPCIQNP